MRRRPWLWVIAIPVLLVIGDVAYWRYAEHQMEAGLRLWVRQNQAAGWQTSLGPTHEGGWPLSVRLTVNGLTVQGGASDVPGGLRWHADRVDLTMDLWRPTAFNIILPAEQRVQVGAAPELAVTADRLVATIPLRFQQPPDQIDVLARNLRATPAQNPAPGEALSVGLLQAHAALLAAADQPAPAAPREEPTLRFGFSAEAVGLPQTLRWPLGPILSSLTIDGTLNGRLPLERGLTQAATAWRDGGGSLEIQHFAMGWGPLGLTATATLALDDQLQPMGAGTSHVVGYAASLDAMANDGMLSRSAAIAAKAMLSLLAGTPDDGGAAEVDVPLTLQYRTLSMRQVPLVRLPELDWPPR
jgi:hypothetical protein